MTHIRGTWARLATTIILASGALMGAGAAAQADPPPGWEPGPDSIEYNFGDTAWVHQGFYAGVAGNWHTGWLNVEEDDDGLTAELIDWKCPAGATPPDPNIGSARVPTVCKLKRFQRIEYTQYFDVATFNQKRDRLVVRGDYPAFDLNGEPQGAVHLNMYLEGVGTPTVESTTTAGLLDYSEDWSTARLVGKIDGHGLAGRGTRQIDGYVSFYLQSWVPVA